MGTPSIPTQKRLFAVSGNRCAFRNCRQALVDKPSGKVTARICHIKGNKPGSKRHDPIQSETERQGFGNLVLMCPIHHDVIDADDVAYTVDILRSLKAEHEARFEDNPTPDRNAEELFLDNVSLEVSDGSIIQVANQSGGQIAHVIHNTYGTAPPPQSLFRAELAKRHLADVDDPEFSRTAHQKRLGVARDGQLVRAPATAVVFSHFPKPVLTSADEAGFLRWADCNKLRYEPCTTYPFLPTPTPDRVGSALVWHDGGNFHRPGAQQCCLRYVALERAGWVEAGFSPLGDFDPPLKLYYAQVVANVVGFLGFVRQVADERRMNPADISTGLALRGIKDASLTCITDRLMRGYSAETPPDRNSFLALRPSEDGPWTPDGVAREFAEALLDHWAFPRPGWMADPPEFTAGSYTGKFFRNKFMDW